MGMIQHILVTINDYESFVSLGTGLINDDWLSLIRAEVCRADKRAALKNK